MKVEMLLNIISSILLIGFGAAAHTAFISMAVTGVYVAYEPNTIILYIELVAPIVAYAIGITCLIMNLRRIDKWLRQGKD